MDLELTSDQELLRDTTLQFLQAGSPLTVVRSWAEDPAGFDSSWWRRGADLGWTSLLVSESDGGGTISGHGLSDLSLVAEQMGVLVASGPLIPVNTVAQTISLEAPAEIRELVLPGLLAGESVATWCVAEPGRPFTPDGVELAARWVGVCFVLDGVKSPVEAGAEADWFLVTARRRRG